MACEEGTPPIFVISSNSDGELILAALRAGVKEFLPKPIDIQDLESAVKYLLPGAQPEASVESPPQEATSPPPPDRPPGDAH